MVSIIVIYPTDPLGPKIGGAETFMKGVIRYAPEDFDIKLVGISSDRIKRPPGRWVGLKLGTKAFDFLPLFFEKEENRKSLVPLSLRFTLALKFSSLEPETQILFFNRIEPAILFRKSKAFKIGIVHNDIQKQLLQNRSEVLWSRFSRLYFMFEGLVFPSLDYIYTVSKNTLEFYRSKYPGQKYKFSFLPTWVDPAMFYPGDKTKVEIRQNCLLTDKQLPLEGRWILFVGRLQRQKAPLRLIQTFARYNEMDKESCLLIIGKGNLEQQVKNYIAELGLGNSVYFLGSKGQTGLAEYYRAADVMLLTSNFEGMPMCVLEALGSGLPVVSTKVGEVGRVVRNGFSGEVVESFSPETIARSIGEVLNNPDVYSKDNCIKAVSEYTPEKVLKPVYEMMRRLYNKRYVAE